MLVALMAVQTNVTDGQENRLRRNYEAPGGGYPHPATTPTPPAAERAEGELSFKYYHPRDGPEILSPSLNNIQLLFLDTTKLMSNMGFMAKSLGVQCQYCHDLNDFSSDVMLAKQRAREMIRLVEQLNAAGGEQEITCRTCHQGATLARPPPESAAHSAPAADDQKSADTTRAIQQQTITTIPRPESPTAKSDSDSERGAPPQPSLATEPISAAELKNRVQDHYLDKALRQGERYMQTKGEELFGESFRFDANLGLHRGNLFGEADALIPFKAEQTATWFAQPGLVLWRDRRDNTRTDLSLGFGRRAYLNSRGILGGALFYDYNVDHGHQRLGLAGDWQSGPSYFSFNLYRRLSGWQKDAWRDASYIYDERAADGYDFRFDHRITSRWRVAGGVFGWRAGERGVNLSGASLQSGFQFRPGMELTLGYEDFGGRTHRSGWNIGVHVRWPPAGESVYAPAGQPDLFRPVSREKRIFVEERRRQRLRARLAFSQASLSVSVAEDAGTAGVAVSLTQPLETAITLQVSTADDTAKAGADYTALSDEPVTIAAGQTDAMITVLVINDDTVEPDETFTLTMTADNLPAGVTVDADTATVTIRDDDTSAIITLADASANEGADAVVGITLDKALPTALTLTMRVTDVDTGRDDYRVADPPVVFAPNTQSASFAVAIHDDDVVESDERFTVAIAETSGAPDGVVLTTTDTATVTITGADTAVVSLSVDPPIAAEGNSGVTTRTLRITLSNPVAEAVRVTLASTDGSATTADNDYAAVNHTLTFPPNDNTAQEVTLTINGDRKAEANEDFTVALSALTLPAHGRVTVDIAPLTLTITNDDTADLGFAAANFPVGEADGSAEVGVTLNNKADRNILLHFTLTHDTSEPADVTGAPFTATINAGDIGAILAIPIVNDPVVEGEERFTIELSVDDLPDGIVLGVTTATVTIADDDTALVSLPGAVAVSEDAGPADIVVSLSNPVAQEVTVRLSTADGGTATAGTDYTALTAAAVTISVGATAVTAMVDIINDDEVEQDETFTVTLTAEPSLLPGGVSVDTAAGVTTVTITNDDVVRLDGEALYTSLGCNNCHRIPGFAPVPGVVEDWRPRFMARGRAGLYNSAIVGVSGTLMSARGGNQEATDEELMAVVDWYLEQAGLE